MGTLWRPSQTLRRRHCAFGSECTEMLQCCLQIPAVTGKWVDHPSSNHLGYYDPRTDCPDYAQDFNCLRPYPPAEVNEELAAREYRKV